MQQVGLNIDKSLARVAAGGSLTLLRDTQLEHISVSTNEYLETCPARPPRRWSAWQSVLEPRAAHSTQLVPRPLPQYNEHN